MTQETDVITTDVFHCARCGEHHPELRFARLTRPMVDTDGTVWERWTLCPTLHEPILMSKRVHPEFGEPFQRD